LSAPEGAMVSKVYLKNILLLKAQESAFQDGYVALLILFILGMFATMMLFKKIIKDKFSTHKHNKRNANQKK
jgi:formate hydrogenlyase subunit 3/multisubunit Na+/H+ antiporter MnhD subunit